MNRFCQHCTMAFITLGIATLLTSLYAAEYEPQTICSIDVHIKPEGTPEPEPPVLPSHKILGEIVVLGRPVPGVTIVTDHEGPTCITDEKGQFSLEVPWGWTGTVTPTKAGWTFDPPSRFYDCVTRDIDDRTSEQTAPEEWPPCIDTEEDLSYEHESSTATPPAWGRLAVTPMVISLEGEPGQTLTSSVSIQNMGIQSPQVSLALGDLAQQPNGPWQPVEIDPTESLPRSCRPWVKLQAPQGINNTMNMGTMICPFEINIPSEARGFYSTALLVQPNQLDQTSSPVTCTLVIPILINVKNGPAEIDVAITNAELLIPFSSDHSQVPRVRLSLENRGETLCCFNATVIAQASDKLHHDTGEPEMRFERQWIMPGACLTLETDYIGPQPDQPLTLRASLDLIQESIWVTTVGSSPEDKSQQPAPLKLTKESTMTVAMIDYNDQQKIHMKPLSGYDFSELLGDCQLGLATNFPARIQPVVQEAIANTATWSASVTPTCMHGPTNALLTVKASDVAIEKLPGGQRNLLIARLGVLIIPEIGSW